MTKDIITYHRYRDSHGRSPHDVCQKAISAKIDLDIMEMVDMECFTGGIARNRLINLALKWYINELDEARRIVAGGMTLDKYILNIDTSSLSCEELENLEFIANGFGCDVSALARHALQVMLKDYDKNPYRWMP